MNKRDKESLVRELVELIPEKKLRALLDEPQDGILWDPNDLDLENKAFRDLLKLSAFDSHQDYAKFYQALLMIAAAYGPQSKALRETISLMLQIGNQARASMVAFRETDYVDRLATLWKILQDTVFASMSKVERDKAFGMIQAKIRELHLPDKVMQIGMGK